MLRTPQPANPWSGRTPAALHEGRRAIRHKVLLLRGRHAVAHGRHEVVARVALAHALLVLLLHATRHGLLLGHALALLQHRPECGESGGGGGWGSGWGSAASAAESSGRTKCAPQPAQAFEGWGSSDQGMHATALSK